MRVLRDQADLSDLPPDLRAVVEACLQRWEESGLIYDPADEVVILVEPRDSIDDLIAFSSSLSALRDGDAPPFEWVIDCGCCFEAGMVTSDDGAGYSLIVSKADGIDGRLLKCCTDLAADDPGAP